MRKRFVVNVSVLVHFLTNMLAGLFFRVSCPELPDIQAEPLLLTLIETYSHEM